MERHPETMGDLTEARGICEGLIGEGEDDFGEKRQGLGF
jgi:hypothetical protein